VSAHGRHAGCRLFPKFGAAGQRQLTVFQAGTPNVLVSGRRNGKGTPEVGSRPERPIRNGVVKRIRESFFWPRRHYFIFFSGIRHIGSLGPEEARTGIRNRCGGPPGGLRGFGIANYQDMFFSQGSQWILRRLLNGKIPQQRFERDTGPRWAGKADTQGTTRYGTKRPGGGGGAAGTTNY